MLIPNKTQCPAGHTSGRIWWGWLTTRGNRSTVCVPMCVTLGGETHQCLRPRGVSRKTGLWTARVMCRRHGIHLPLAFRRVLEWSTGIRVPAKPPWGGGGGFSGAKGSTARPPHIAMLRWSREGASSRSGALGGPTRRSHHQTTAGWLCVRAPLTPPRQGAAWCIVLRSNQHGRMGTHAQSTGVHCVVSLPAMASCNT